MAKKTQRNAMAEQYADRAAYYKAMADTYEAASKAPFVGIVDSVGKRLRSAIGICAKPESGCPGDILAELESGLRRLASLVRRPIDGVELTAEEAKARSTKDRQYRAGDRDISRRGAGIEIGLPAREAGAAEPAEVAALRAELESYKAEIARLGGAAEVSTGQVSGDGPSALDAARKGKK